jgi:hypothetical protein
MRKVIESTRARVLAGCAALACIALAWAAPWTSAAVTPASAASYTSVPGRLYGVSVVSASNAWAVGLVQQSALIMHWDGHQWSQYLKPPGYFAGVDARASNDVWAVGGTGWFTGAQPLIMHFGGLRWHRIPAPSPSGGGILSAVAATSARNAWAVGLVGPGPGTPSPTQLLIEHWNGTRWTRVASPNLPGSTADTLIAVTVIASNNIWAVGTTDYASTLIAHWNGHSWS